MKLKTIPISISIIALILTLTGCGGKNDARTQAAPAPMPYPVVTLANKTVTGNTAYPVSIEGIINSNVRAKVSGYIEKVLIDEGERVKKGQPLFKLETQSLSQEAEAAKARVNAAQVEVDKLVPLVEKNIISKVQLETAKANLSQAKSSYNSIVANIDYATVKSPVNGYAGAIPFREGTLVSPSDPTPLTTVADIQKVYAFFSMNEREYLDFLEKTPGETLENKIANFPEIELILANGSVYKHKGKIETVTGQVDPKTGTVSFRAVFDNPEHLITNGNSGRISIPVTYKDAVIIPQSATYEQQGQIFLYKLGEGDTALSTKVEILDAINNLYVISSGVSAGEKIIAAGVGKLRNNTVVAPQEVSFDSVIQPTKVLFK